MTEECSLRTILKATLESPDSKLRLNVTSEIGKVKEELKQLFEHEIKLATEWRQIGYAEQLRRIKKKVFGA